MRKCASVADSFATFVNGGASSVDSPVALMLRDLVTAAKPDATADDKATGGKRKRKIDAGDDTEAPKRRKRKPKDPNAPKRPASSYIFFQNEVRKKIKASNPNISNSELLTMISKQWQEMSEEDKAVSVYDASLKRYTILTRFRFTTKPWRTQRSGTLRIKKRMIAAPRKRSRQPTLLLPP